MVKNRTIKKYGLEFDKSVTAWDEAVPLGNGRLGCLMYGTAQPFIFSLDRVDIWDCTPNPETQREDFTYSQLLGLVRGGKQNQSEILRRFDDIYYYPTPTKLPVGHIELEFSHASKAVTSKLDIFGAAAEAVWDGNKIFSYIHSEKNIGFIEICGERPIVKLVSPLYRDASYKLGATDDEKCFRNKLAALKYDNAEHFKKDGTYWFVQPTNGVFEYAIVCHVTACEGETRICYTVACSNDGADWLTDARGLVERESGISKQIQLRGHRHAWKDFYAKSSLSIPDKTLEKCWYYNNYLLNSCSREGGYPMPLQGVWTADSGFLPPWKGDYHHDLNTQMSYYSYLKSNHLQNGKCFVDYLWDNRASAEKFAETFFDCRDGLAYPTVCAIDGTPLGGWPQYSINLVNNIWLAQAFENYYLYTDDLEFLKTRCYPYFVKVANCVMRCLTKDENGNYVLPLSSSPEVYDNSFEAWLRPNSNNDLTLLIYLFSTLAKYSVLLGAPDTQKWCDYLSHLDNIYLSDDSSIMLTKDKKLHESHRHLGHAMSIYPLKLICYDTEKNKKIIDATIADIEKLGNGYWGCFTYAWVSTLYSIQGNGNAAWYHLRVFCDYYLSKNGFNLNFDYKNYGITAWHQGRPFTLESNFGFNDALQEMLLQSDGDTLRLFPALPEQFGGNASFTDFRAYRGVTVSAALLGGQCQTIKLYSQKAVAYRLLNNFGTTEFEIRAGGGVRTAVCAAEDFLAAEIEGEVFIKPIYRDSV